MAPRADKAPGCLPHDDGWYEEEVLTRHRPIQRASDMAIIVSADQGGVVGPGSTWDLILDQERGLGFLCGPAFPRSLGSVRSEDAFSAASGQVLQRGLRGKFMPGIRLVSNAHRPGSYRVGAH